MRPRYYCLLALAAALPAAAFTQSGCSPINAQARTVEAAQPPEVEVVTVRAEREASVVEMPGAVAAVRAVTLMAPVGGRGRVLADQGAQLSSGAEAAALEVPGLPESVSAARASVDAAERRQSGARTGVSQAQREQETSVAALEQTLAAAEAERDRRKSVLTEAQLQAQTEPARLKAQLLGAEAHLRQLQSGEREQRIRQLVALLEVADAEQRTAEQQLKRQRRLYAQGYISRAELELSELGVERARANQVTHAEELRLAREGAHPEAIK